MNAIFLMLPLFLIRFAILGILNKTALQRAAFFAPLIGKEKLAFVFYQLSNIFIVLYPLFLSVQTKAPIFIIGLCVYLLGIGVLLVSTIFFAKPEQNGININGIYRLSRNPMYMGYFLYFGGSVLLAPSLLLFLALIIFILSSHWIILSEERWCLKQFGDEYVKYMHKVRRYL